MYIYISVSVYVCVDVFCAPGADPGWPLLPPLPPADCALRSGYWVHGGCLCPGWEGHKTSRCRRVPFPESHITNHTWCAHTMVSPMQARRARRRPRLAATPPAPARRLRSAARISRL